MTFWTTGIVMTYVYFFCMLPVLGEVTNSAAALLGFVYQNSNRFLFTLPNVNLANAKRFRCAYWVTGRRGVSGVSVGAGREGEGRLGEK